MSNPNPITTTTNESDASTTTAVDVTKVNPKPAKQPKQPKQPPKGKVAVEPKPNKLLIPKYKQRTAETHQKHLQQLRELASSNQSPTVLVAGSSMWERWLTTGESLWRDQITSKYRVFNAGVGGDQVQNLIWRTTPGRDIPTREAPEAPPSSTNEPSEIGESASATSSSSSISLDPSTATTTSPPTSLLENLSVELVLLFIGTNNIEKDKPEQIVEGISVLIQQIIDTQPNLRQVVVYGLHPRKDVPLERVLKCNELLKPVVSKFAPYGAIYNDDLTNAVQLNQHYDDHVHFNEAGYKVWTPILLKQIEEGLKADRPQTKLSEGIKSLTLADQL